MTVRADLVGRAIPFNAPGIKNINYTKIIT
jgi:hypothetical protein